MRSVQCQKSLYLYKNYYHQRDKPSNERERLFNRGNRVGEIARDLFPNGVDVSPEHVFKFTESVERTKLEIASGMSTIYEAAFIQNEVLIAVDILNKSEDGWSAYEVKNSIKISKTFVLDACLQYYVLKKAIPDLKDFFLVTLNPEYVYDGNLNLHQLFKFTSIKVDAEKNFEYFEKNISTAIQTLDQGMMPNISVGEQCFSPYDCDYLGTCWDNLKNNEILNVGGVSKVKQVEWIKKGFTKVTDLLHEKEAPNIVLTQAKAAIHQGEIYDRDKIADFFSGIKLPIGFIDIEVASFAIPVFVGTRPFSQIPFLFSLLSLEEDKQEYLFFSEPKEDRRKAFVEGLIKDTNHFASLVVFDASLEKMVLKNLASLFPEYTADLEKIKEKIVDIAPLIQRGYYYHPQMNGSFDLKSTEKALNENSFFSELKINSGIHASFAYEDMFFENKNSEPNSIFDLTEYCKADTLAARFIYKKLKSLIN